MVQSSVACVAQSEGGRPFGVLEACAVSATRNQAQALLAESMAVKTSHSTSEPDAQYSAVKQAAHFEAAKFSMAISRLVAAPVISTNNGSILSDAASHAPDQQRPFPAVIERRGTHNAPSLLQCANRCATDEKKKNCKIEQQSKKREVHALLDVFSPEIETPEEIAKPAARVTDGKHTGVNPQGLREVPEAVMLHDDEPPWALLACSLVLVGAFLTSLLALIYALTTVVPTSETMHPAPAVTPASGTVYCSSEFCDREADYLVSLLGARGKGACDNFYEHVCGAWPRAHLLKGFTGAGAVVSTDTIIQDTIDNGLTSLLPSNRAEDVGMAVALYHACTDRNKADSAANHVKGLFKAWKIGMWPRDVSGSVNEIWEFAGELVRDLGLGSILDMAVAIGTGGNDNPVVELRQPEHVLSCNDVWRPPVTTLFHNALSDLSLEFTHSPRQEILDEVMSAFIRLGSCPVNPAIAESQETKFGVLPDTVAKLSELNDDVQRFLMIAFDGGTMPGPGTVVVLKPASYVREYLAAAMRELPPRALMNYMGLLALVHLSPFLPERHVHLRQLFVKLLRGRTLPDVSNSSTLCMMAVERALPACLSKLSATLFTAAEYNVRVPEKLSQLEDVFARNVHHLAWLSDELALVNRYRLKRRRSSHFGPSVGRNSSCVPSGVARRTDIPVQFYRDMCRAQQRSRLEAIASGRSLAKYRVVPVRPSSVRAVYDRLLRRVLVPAALFNTSVPGNSAGFSLQLARYAVRFYRALLDALLLNDWDSGRDEAVRRKLQALLQCFEWDLHELPATLKGTVGPDPERSRAALLLQTTALQLAFRAFQDLWQ
ncbi:hypothetical protein V5799_008942, partial [Amblyomma americanum]